MIQLGSFPQLEQILDQVQSENPMDDDDDEEDEVIEDDVNDPDRLLGLPGIPGEARVQMLSDDVLRQLDALRGESGNSEVVETREIEDDEFDEMEMMLGDDAADDSEDELSLPLAPPVYRQTFVFSATLTLPATKVSKPNKKRRFDGNVGGAIAEILDKSHAKGKTKVVDLSTHTKGNEILEKKSKKESKNAPPSEQSNFQLPPGLQLQHIKCTQKHKDSYLYAYLMTTRQGMSGPSLVFCNSIAGAKRVAKTLQTLGIDVRVLHAQMQQVSQSRRFRAPLPD
jgi:ATP-dependent RNA helicase DDX24/MAK5